MRPRKLPFNPQPTSNTNYQSYYWPRSKRPELQAIYDRLFELGWRFDSHYGLWFTPEADVMQAHGILEHASDCSWFRIQPPSFIENGIPYRPEPLLQGADR